MMSSMSNVYHRMSNGSVGKTAHSCVEAKCQHVLSILMKSRKTKAVILEFCSTTCFDRIKKSHEQKVHFP